MSVGLTNLGNAGASALNLVQSLAQTAMRTLRDRLHALLGGAPTTSAAAAPATRAAPVAVAAPPSGPATTRAADHPHGGAASPHAVAPAARQGRAALIARDPWSLFAHWEVPAVRRVEMLRALGTDGETAREVLRLYDTAQLASTFRDVELAPGAGHADIGDVAPGRSYRVEIGLRTVTGRFVPLVASTVASTPPAAPSDDTTVRWVSLAAATAPREVAASWSGRRVPVTPAGTELQQAGDASARAAGSSEAMPPGPRASDALPLR